MKNFISALAFLLFFFTALAGELDNRKLTFPGTNDGYLVVPMPDDGYLMLTYVSHGNSIAARLDANGNRIWTKSIADVSAFWLNDAVASADSGAFLIYSADSFSTTLNYTVIKLNKNGEVAWTNAFDLGDHGWQYKRTMAKPQSDGGLVFAASVYGQMAGIRINANGTMGYSMVIAGDANGQNKFPGFDAERTADGGMIVTGKNSTYPVIARLNPYGTTAWVKDYFSTGYWQARSLIQTIDGNYLTAGMFIDFQAVPLRQQPQIMKIDPAGNVLWKKHYEPDSVTTGLKFGEFSQAVQNADGSVTLLGTVSADNTDYYYAVTTIAANGGVLRAFKIPYKRPDVSGFAGGPRLYKGEGSADAKVSFDEFDTQQNTWQTTVMKVSQLSDYCQLQPITFVERPIAAFNVTAVTSYYQSAVSAPTHPDIETQNASFNFTTSNVCLTTGIESLQGAQASEMFPNPVSSGVSIIVKWADNVSVSVSVYNVNGALVREAMVSNGNQVVVNTSDLVPGIYMVALFNNAGIKTEVKKLVITG